MDFECWWRPIEPATATEMVLWNRSDIASVAGKKASKKFPAECHKSSYALFDSYWSMYRATGVVTNLQSYISEWFSIHLYLKNIP